MVEGGGWRVALVGRRERERDEGGGSSVTSEESRREYDCWPVRWTDDKHDDDDDEL